MGRVVIADALARCAVVLLACLGRYRLQATVTIILEGKVCILEAAVHAQPTIGEVPTYPSAGTVSCEKLWDEVPRSDASSSSEALSGCG